MAARLFFWRAAANTTPMLFPSPRDERALVSISGHVLRFRSNDTFVFIAFRTRGAKVWLDAHRRVG
jgi:hypothetical protein